MKHIGWWKWLETRLDILIAWSNQTTLYTTHLTFPYLANIFAFYRHKVCISEVCSTTTVLLILLSPMLYFTVMYLSEFIRLAVENDSLELILRILVGIFNRPAKIIRIMQPVNPVYLVSHSLVVFMARREQEQIELNWKGFIFKLKHK